jgi:hypothetical protein
MQTPCIIVRVFGASLTQTRVHQNLPHIVVCVACARQELKDALAAHEDPPLAELANVNLAKVDSGSAMGKRFILYFNSLVKAGKVSRFRLCICFVVRHFKIQESKNPSHVFPRIQDPFGKENEDTDWPQCLEVSNISFDIFDRNARLGEQGEHHCRAEERDARRVAAGEVGYLSGFRPAEAKPTYQAECVCFSVTLEDSMNSGYDCTIPMRAEPWRPGI